MIGDESSVRDAWYFFKRHWMHVLGISALLLVPCFWHRHIEAGDLGSHLYNAWLAQLIDKGEAPGLYIVHQWSNVLVDVALLHVSNLLGFWIAEKLVVSACVLIFFWGVFALIGAVSDDAQWPLMPCVAMLAYGYAFNMGFLNFYLSIGLGCFCLAAVWPMTWSGRTFDWIVGLLFAGLAWLAHPIGSLWAVATIAYLTIYRLLPRKWIWLVPASAIAALLGFRWYLHHRKELAADWFSGLPVWKSNGADQLMVYGDRYETLAIIAVAFGVLCVLIAAFQNRRNLFWWKGLALPGELYLVAFVAIASFPENFRVSIYAAWIGLLVSRLTVICAILGLCFLARAELKQWTLAGFLILATAYFLFLAQDTRTLSRLEENAEKVLAPLPYGTRIVPTIKADPDWRVEFVAHVADRACIRRCFVYSNYEPPSKQFRIRVGKGGRVFVTDSADDADDMQGGGYEIDQSDLPLKQLYQCDRDDWTKLCLRDLAAGESTGKAGLFHPER